MLWYSTVTPWSRSCTLRVWLLYMIEIGGVTSWYQSRLPVGNPLTTPWSKLSLVFAKTILLTYYLAYGPTLLSLRVKSMVLGSFSPHLYSGNLISLLFRVKDLANSNSRFSWLLPPGEPLIADDHRVHQKTPKILSDKLPRPYVHIAFAIPYHR